MLVHPDPWWLEVVITSVLAIVFASWNHEKSLRLARSLSALPADLEHIKAWVKNHGKNYKRADLTATCLTAPCWEECVSRVLPVTILQLSPAWWPVALGTGLLLNVWWSAQHRGMPWGYFQAKHRHQVAAFILGLACLGAGMTTGLLAAAIAVHAAWNTLTAYMVYHGQPFPLRVSIAGERYTFNV